MEVLAILVPLAILLGSIGLAGFLWSLKSGQYEDLDGAAWRVILDDEPVDLPQGKPDHAQRNHDSGPGQYQSPVNPSPM